MSVSKYDSANWYTHVFKNWQVKLYGPKPSNDMLEKIHGLGARPGKQALANAMALRECGVTGAQIVMVCGAPQLNKMRGFITDKLLRRLPAAPSAEGHTVYKLELTPKGAQRIETQLKRIADVEAAAEKATSDVLGRALKKAKATKKAKAKAKAKAAGKAADASKQAKGSKAKAKAEKPLSEAPKPVEAPPEANKPEAGNSNPDQA